MELMLHFLSEDSEIQYENIWVFFQSLLFFFVAIQEKEKAKIKEKLDKCVKESLLQLSDLLDLGIHKTGTKKVRGLSS